MPHQCLKCGKTFEEGSIQLLRGCPSCDGSQFFYTKKPLSEEERKAVAKKLEEDIDSKFTGLIHNKLLSDSDSSEDCVDAKSTDIEAKETKIEKSQTEPAGRDNPETINIEEPGKYKIDLKGLLEEQPVIIEKDGSYIIHLPSAFKIKNKEKEGYIE